jgi:hypothetical protein
VKVAGIDHVGIGSDFDGVSGPPNGLDDVSKMPALIEVLLERGYKERDVKEDPRREHSARDSRGDRQGEKATPSTLFASCSGKKETKTKEIHR